jgi:hypothetical protein
VTPRRFLSDSPCALALLAMAAAWLASPAVAQAPRACDASGWTALVREHVERYPRLEAADVYKLLHQATMGSEHYVVDREMAADWLTREMSGLGTGPEEPLVDPLGRAVGTVRIHLRPFLDRGGDPDRLLDAFVGTVTAVAPRPDALECALDAASGLTVSGELPFETTEFVTYVDERRAAGFEAVHHSEEFGRLYRPAYRVIARELVAEVLAGTRR